MNNTTTQVLTPTTTAPVAPVDTTTPDTLPVAVSTSTPVVNPHVLAVTAYMEDGMDMSAAIGKRMEESGAPRATVYGAMRRAGLTGTITPKAPVDPIEAARALLVAALANVDKDVDALKTAADAATVAYRAAKAGAKDRKKDLNARIAALTV